MRQPIAIVGGGIGGLTMALALHRRDIECTVFERAPALNEIGAGLGVWPAALRVLDRLGIGDEVRALSAPWRHAGIRMSDGRTVLGYRAEDFARIMGEIAIGVHRGELQSLLLRSLPVTTVQTGVECLGVSESAAVVEVDLAGREPWKGGLVIGADGRRSRVRASVFGDRPLHDCKAMGWRGSAPMPEGATWGDYGGETWGPEGRFGVLPIAGGRVTWYGAVAKFRDGGGREELLDRFGGWHSPIPELIHATPDDHIWVDAIDDRFPSRRWTTGRVALLGDAAHPMSPDLGQGACQAIMDAAVLAEELANAGDGLSAALRRYERRRRWRAGMVTLVARASTAGARTERRMLVEARGKVVGLVPPSAALRALRWVAAGP